MPPPAPSIPSSASHSVACSKSAARARSISAAAASLSSLQASSSAHAGPSSQQLSLQPSAEHGGGLIFASSLPSHLSSSSSSTSSGAADRAIQTQQQRRRRKQRPTIPPTKRDPYFQPIPDSDSPLPPKWGAALHPLAPELAPPLTIAYRSAPHPTSFPVFAALLAALPAHLIAPASSALNSARSASETPPTSSISTHPSTPATLDPPELSASVLTQATSIPDTDSNTANPSTPQPTEPKKLPAWGTPKSWAQLAASSAKNSPSSGPVGVSVNYTHPPVPAPNSDLTSPARSPKAPRKSAEAKKPTTARPQIVSLERLLADSHTHFDAPLTHPRGLVNHGNFCFANAILQMLVYCAPFYNLFTLIGREVPADFGNSTPLMEAVINFLREFHVLDKAQSASEDWLVPTMPTGASEAFVPEFVYDAMRLNKRFDQMRRGHQEDAEEFLGFFLDTLHEELLSAIRRSAIKLVQAGSGAHSLLAKMSQEEKRLNGITDDDLRRMGLVMGKTSANAAAQPSALGLALNLDDDDTIEERELARPVSPSEQGWMEVGQKGKTAFTRTTSTSESPITRIFGGKLRSVLKCPGAKDSVTLEPYQPLQLDIQPPHVQSIEDALLNLTVPEVIPGVYSPAKGAHIDATKQVFIESLPPVLILHLKRFVFDEVGGVQKSQKPLAYGTTLEIAPEVLSPTIRGSAKQQKYRLFGVVYHHGRYASGGHYTVDVLRQDGKSWLHIDDTQYQTIPTEHVVRTAASNSNSNSNNSSGSASLRSASGHDGLAYLLFYRRESESATADATAAVASTKKAPAAAPPTAPAAMRAAAARSSKQQQQQQQQHAVNGKPAAPSAGSGARNETPASKRTVPGWTPHRST